MSLFRRQSKALVHPAESAAALRPLASEDAESEPRPPLIVTRNRSITLPHFPTPTALDRDVNAYAPLYEALDRDAVLVRNTTPHTATALHHGLGIPQPTTYALADYDPSPNLFEWLRARSLTLESVRAWDGHFSSGEAVADGLVVDVKSVGETRRILVAFGLHETGRFIAHYCSPEFPEEGYGVMEAAIRGWPQRDAAEAVSASAAETEPEAAEAAKYEIPPGYSYARDRLGAGMGWAADLGGDDQSGVRWPVPSFLVGPSDEKTLRALENVVAVIDEYVSSLRYLYGGRTVIAGVDFLELTQRLNQLRTHPGGVNAIKRADAEVPIIRPILAGLKMLVLVSDCGVTRDEVPDDVAELLKPTGPREVDRVIQYLLEQLSG